jgi:ADP-ribosylglycohydrolase
MSLNNSVLSALVADAQALGPHWIYDQAAIAAAFTNFDNFAAPMATYHEGKKAGDFTHYGDQTMLLVRHMKNHGGQFDLASFASEWRAFWENPTNKSYRDGATKATLANLQEGKSPLEAGSPSVDISAVGRIAPLLRLGTHAAVLAAVKAHTRFTHSDEVVQAAEWFAAIALAVAAGTAPDDAVRTILPPDHLAAGAASAASAASDADALKLYGLGCKTEMALPGIVHLILRYRDDGAKAMEQNLFAGGDTSGRGMILAMIYGAMPGASPSALAEKLTVASELTSLLS